MRRERSLEESRGRSSYERGGAGLVFTLAQNHLYPGSPRKLPALLVYAQSWRETSGPVVRAPAPIRRSGRSK